MNHKHIACILCECISRNLGRAIQRPMRETWVVFTTSLVPGLSDGLLCWCWLNLDKEESTKNVRNIGSQSPRETASHRTQLKSSKTPLWEPQVSHIGPNIYTTLSRYLLPFSRTYRVRKPLGNLRLTIVFKTVSFVPVHRIFRTRA
jgi:hypothetical protein